MMDLAAIISAIAEKWISENGTMMKREIIIIECKN